LDLSVATLFEMYPNAPDDFWRLKVQRRWPHASIKHYQTWKERLLETSQWCPTCQDYLPFDQFGTAAYSGDPICGHCGEEHAEFDGPLHLEHGLDEETRQGLGPPWDRRGRKALREKLIDKMEGSADVANIIVDDFLPLRRDFDPPWPEQIPNKYWLQ